MIFHCCFARTKWNEKNGAVVPMVGVPHGMTHWTPETQPAVAKCHAPFYKYDDWLTGYRLSHWLSGGCTIDYGSVSVKPLWHVGTPEQLHATILGFLARRRESNANAKYPDEERSTRREARTTFTRRKANSAR